MLLTIAERFRDVLEPFLIAGNAALLAMLAVLIIQRLGRAAVERRRNVLKARYRPLVEAALMSDSADALDAVRRIPRRHHDVAAEKTLARLRIVRGEQVERARRIAEALDLSARWRGHLQSRLWWRRSEAALALGLLRDKKAVPLLTPLLDDEHEQVRAAVIDALGQIGDTTAIAPLLARMSDPSRHERARLVQALRAFGERATNRLVAHGTAKPADRAAVATLLSFIGGTGARETLLEWSAAGDPELGAAVWSALATIGLDERAFYHALKALGADAAPVRAAAARSLGRSGRADAAPHLGHRLDDEWEVAAQSARALARLGPDGLRELRQRAGAGEGLGRDLARQVLWESERR